MSAAAGAEHRPAGTGDKPPEAAAFVPGKVDRPAECTLEAASHQAEAGDDRHPGHGWAEAEAEDDHHPGHGWAAKLTTARPGPRDRGYKEEQRKAVWMAGMG